MTFWQVAVLGLYMTVSLCLAIYGTHCYLMIFLFVRKHKEKRKEIQKKIDSYHKETSSVDLPFVTFQLPIFNELSVAERIIESASEIDYPIECFEIQVLDDSTDETILLVDRAVEKVKAKGILIEVIRRVDRKEYKAGALKNAMKTCKGEFIAIFDADFLVPSNFLKRSVALFSDEKIACVQGRWGHINSQENWLTRSQSIGIDGHFTAEQGGRSYHDMCLNFNGTAGVWRKQAIYDGGGWQGDTLTEDLDLSYRVQLEGYKIVYDFDLECKAEIPSDVVALKSQQKRWAKGSMQTAMKLMPRILKSKRLRTFEKVEAFLHMTHYSVAIWMIIMCTLTMPVLMMSESLKLEMDLLLNVIWGFIIISAMAPCVMYTGSGMVLGKGRFSFINFPAMLVLGTGLCVNNSMAVIEAFIGKKSSFVRTPKSGSTDDQKRGVCYKADTSLVFSLVEIAFGVYAFFTLLHYFNSESHIFGFFIFSYAIGMTCFGLMTFRKKLLYWRHKIIMV